MTSTLRLLSLIATLIASLGATSPHAAELSPATATQFAQATFRDYFELLALPNDAIAPADIRKNVDWLEAAFRKRGFTTQQLPNEGKPMLFAELPGADAKHKTVLFYMPPRRPAGHSRAVAAEEPVGAGCSSAAMRKATGRRSIRRHFSTARSDPEWRRCSVGLRPTTRRRS